MRSSSEKKGQNHEGMHTDHEREAVLTLSSGSKKAATFSLFEIRRRRGPRRRPGHGEQHSGLEWKIEDFSC